MGTAPGSRSPRVYNGTGSAATRQHNSRHLGRQDLSRWDVSCLVRSDLRHRPPQRALWRGEPDVGQDPRATELGLQYGWQSNAGRLDQVTWQHDEHADARGWWHGWV